MNSGPIAADGVRLSSSTLGASIVPLERPMQQQQEGGASKPAKRRKGAAVSAQHGDGPTSGGAEGGEQEGGAVTERIGFTVPELLQCEQQQQPTPQQQHLQQQQQQQLCSLLPQPHAPCLRSCVLHACDGDPVGVQVSS